MNEFFDIKNDMAEVLPNVDMIGVLAQFVRLQGQELSARFKFRCGWATSKSSEVDRLDPGFRRARCLHEALRPLFAWSRMNGSFIRIKAWAGTLDKFLRPVALNGIGVSKASIMGERKFRRTST